MSLPTGACRKWSQNSRSLQRQSAYYWDGSCSATNIWQRKLWWSLCLCHFFRFGILALLSPNNGRSFVFLCMSGWKRDVLVVCVRSCKHGRFVRPASAHLSLKLSCRHSEMCCLYLWNGHGFCFPSNNAIPCCSPTLYSFKSLQLLIDTVLSVMHAQNPCVFRKRICGAAVLCDSCVLFSLVDLCCV